MARHRGRMALSWTIAALTPAMTLAAVVIDRSAASGQRLSPVVGPLVVVALAIPVVVALGILRRRPTNRIGWIMLVGPVPVALLLLAESYSWIGVESGDPLPGQGIAGVLSISLWPSFYVWPLAIALLFPTGGLPSPRWRPAAATIFASAALVMILILVGEEGLDPERGDSPNPLRIDGIERLEPVFWIAWGLLLVGLFVAAGSVIVRFRRSQGVERLQLKWLAWSSSLIPAGLVACAASYAALGSVELFVPAVLLAAGCAIAISVGIAVTRHGLYAIDRLINRTLVYASVTVLLSAAFVGVVVVVGTVLGQGSPTAAALATLIVTLAFRPLRDRVQSAIDRYFARARYDGLRRIRAFESALRSGAAAPEDLHAALSDALADPDARLFLRLPHSGDYADVNGRRVAEPRGPDGRLSTVTRRGDEIAVVVHGLPAAGDNDLARAVLEAAVLPIEIVRWRAEVRIQLDEVNASRERIVRAGAEARHRLERDLHDGVQQRLVGLGVALRRLQLSPPREPKAVSAALDEAVAGVSETVADLRTIAAGLRPPRLDDGLAAAVNDLAARAALPVSVDVRAADLPPEVEVAAYYAICEAVTNAVKHSSASAVSVEAVMQEGSLRVAVSDDGAGGAAPGGGTGLTGMSNRVGVHGGRLRINSPVGSGTRIELEMPCES